VLTITDIDNIALNSISLVDSRDIGALSWGQGLFLYAMRALPHCLIAGGYQLVLVGQHGFNMIRQN
jgi:hypothetical protein